MSTAEQVELGSGLAAQRTTITAEVSHRGWTLTAMVEDAGFSARNLKRPGIQQVLSNLANGQADGLVVAKLDRLSRSMLDFTTLMAVARREDWALVALDCAVDTTTPAGEAMANVLATFAQFERRLIGQRTREALALKREQGVRLGRPTGIPPDVIRRIREERSSGSTLAKIADGLNADEIPTGQGGARWWPATIGAVLNRLKGREAASAPKPGEQGRAPSYRGAQ